jgi:hypothetical protein
VWPEVHGASRNRRNSATAGAGEQRKSRWLGARGVDSLDEDDQRDEADVLVASARRGVDGGGGVPVNCEVVLRWLLT